MAPWITAHTDSDAGTATNEKEKDVNISCTSVNSTSESLTSPAPPRRERTTTWGNDSVPESRFAQWDWRLKARWKVRWTWVFHDACQSVWNAMKWAASKTKDAPVWKRVRWSKKQFCASCLVAVWVVVPMTLVGYLTPFTSIFADKTLSCGNGFYGQPQNATVTGIEKLFALDATSGRFSFSQVKAIDVLWDLLVGKGVQALAWWASYNVFCDALLRAIERHAASFDIFQRIASEGPGLHSLWTLTKELWSAKSARTRALFVYMFWSTGYVLLVPIVLGAMTGYDSTSIAWIDLDGENNIIPASQLQQAWVIKGTKNTTNTGTGNEVFQESACADQNLRFDYDYITSSREQNCDCQLPNGTVVTAQERAKQLYASYYYYTNPPYQNCSYNYPNNTQTWTDPSSRYSIHAEASLRPDNTYACNASISVPIDGKTYDADDLDADDGYCYNDVGYYYDYLSNKSRCLPDTANPSYQWGFATLMSGLFIFVTAMWTMSMYVVWQDAQFNCRLVGEGYRLTPLRAAFAMAVAARRRTGLGGKELVREKTAGLERELYGTRGTRGTVIEGHLFVKDAEDEGGDEDGNMRGEWVPRVPLSPPSQAYTSSGTEKAWPSSPGSAAEDHEMRSLVTSDTDVSLHVLHDEELRKRYLRGVEEAKLSRKPLSRESTWTEEMIWESGPRLPRNEERSQDGVDGGDGGGGGNGDEGLQEEGAEAKGESKGGFERQGRKDKKERARLKKSRRCG